MSRQQPPPWVETVLIPSEARGESIRYVLCQNAPTLLYLANLGCIEINPWNSRVATPENPDYMIIDLDPQDIGFAVVVETAVAVRQVLDKSDIPSACKTYAKRSLNLFVPLGARYDHDHARQFGEIISKMVNQTLPKSTSVIRNPALRRGRVYLDYLQNRRGQTLAAPYSVRPYPGATVSTPLKWQEVTKKLDPSRFTINTIPKRLEKVGDLWKPVLGPGIDLAACLSRLSET